MMADRRTLAYVVIALIVGATLAVAVALAGGASPAPTQGGPATQAVQGVPGGSADILGSDQGVGAVAEADPAKTEPLLDQFTAKDPFIPLPTGGSSSGSTTPAPTPSPTATSPTYAARVSVNGTEYTVVVGDKVPTSSPAFKIGAITSGDVTFTVLDGKLENGDSSVTVNLGESVRATLDSGKSYDLAVLSIGQGSGGGGSGTGGHSISVLSITTSNGVAMCTLEVDGTTYPDLEVGDVVKTSWGEIAIIAINPSAQTVTVEHGDVTLVLHAGQVIVK
jgi:hypothetical protein